MVLIVSLSSRNSPLTSTVIFLQIGGDGSSDASNVPDRLVRLLAIRFTLSVRSFRFPPLRDVGLTAQLTLGTHLPSIPVTSEANGSTGLPWFTERAVRRNSPGETDLLFRSPWFAKDLLHCADDPRHFAGRLNRSAIRSLINSTDSAQVPPTSPSETRLIRPRQQIAEAEPILWSSVGSDDYLIECVGSFAGDAVNQR